MKELYLLPNKSDDFGDSANPNQVSYPIAGNER